MISRKKPANGKIPRNVLQIVKILLLQRGMRLLASWKTILTFRKGVVASFLDDDDYFSRLFTYLVLHRPRKKKSKTQVVGVIAHLDGHLHKQNAPHLPRSSCLCKRGGKKREVFESQFCFLTTKLVTNREMLNDFNEETMFLKVFLFPEFVLIGT